MHEAGHALLYYLNDVFIDYMTIIPQGNAEGGVHAASSPHINDDRMGRIHMASAPAGLIAERMLNPTALGESARIDDEHALHNAQVIINKKVCTDLYDRRADLHNQINSLLAFGKQEARRLLNQNKDSPIEYLVVIKTPLL